MTLFPGDWQFWSSGDEGDMLLLGEWMELGALIPPDRSAGSQVAPGLRL